MINTTEYKILTSLKENPTSINEQQFYNELITLLKEKMIDYNVVGETKNNFLYNGFIITSKGYREIENYENLKKQQKIEEEALKTSKEANNIANKARRISLASIIISILSIVVSSLIALLPYLIALFKSQ